MAPPYRAYCRETDVGAEGDIILPLGDKLEKQIASLKDWVSDLDKKVDVLTTNGCSHRGNDLAKLARIETATDQFRNEAGAIKDSIYQLSLSFSEYKTEVVTSSHITDNKINNLKIGILVQCGILLLAVLIFTFKEFVIPATKNIPGYSEGGGTPRISVDIDTWNKMVRDKNSSE